MKYSINIAAAAAVALAVVAPAFAGTQVVAGNGVSLTEAAQAKFNRDTRQDDRHAIVVPVAASGDYGQLAASAGVSAGEARSMTLAEIFVAKINHEARGDEKQAVKGGMVTMGTRSPGAAADRSQLVASAGIPADAAANLSLSEIAAAKFAHDTDTDDR